MKIEVMCTCGAEVTAKDYLTLLWDMRDAGIIREITSNTFERVRLAAFIEGDNCRKKPGSRELRQLLQTPPTSRASPRHDQRGLADFSPGTYLNIPCKAPDPQSLSMLSLSRSGCIKTRVPLSCFSLRKVFLPVETLQVSVARQQEFTAQFTSLTQQRREVLGHPERLESLSLNQANPHVELIPSPKNQSNHQEIINLSNGYEKLYGPQLAGLDEPIIIENAAPPARRETALTS